MKILMTVFIAVLSLCSTHQSFAQGFGTPLTFQGLDHAINPSAISRSSGGVTLGLKNDIDVMFSNPASLEDIQGFQFSVSNVQHSSDANQIQQYSPLSYYSNFSLLMEGLTGNISNPTYDSINHIPSTGADTVQRPFDSIGPNWNHSSSYNIPLQAFAAIPFSLGDTKVSVGIGVVQYANLQWYFQNKNVLNPSILSVDPRTTPIPLNTVDSNSIPVKWSNYFQQRDGSINGYGGAVSFLFANKFSIGISGMILDGSSDDVESSIQRGRIRFYSNYFRLEPIYSSIYESGTSKYSGTEFSVSALYKGKYVALGFSVKPPTEITRTYTSRIVEYYGKYSFDSTMLVWSHLDTSSAVITAKNGKDKMTIPLRGSIDLSLKIRGNLIVGFRYELRPYASAEYKNSGGITKHPWISSNIFHVGLEYMPMESISLRTGIHEQAEVFQPEGSPIDGEPISYSVFSCGIGVTFEHAQINLTYEYGNLKYTDMWASAVSRNSDKNKVIMANIEYEIPW
jgi:hypothetical protein